MLCWDQASNPHTTGAPNTNVSKGIKDEHCVMARCDEEFTTSNYGVTTTPHNEYNISTGAVICPEKDMLDKMGNRVRRIEKNQLKEIELCRSAKLTEDEVLSVVSSIHCHFYAA